MPAFVYVRVATSNQVAMDQQLQVIREYAAKEGLEIPEENVYREVISGHRAILNRPEWLKLWKCLRQDDVLLLTSIDRLGRSIDTIRQGLALLAAAGITLKTVDEAHDD